MKEKLIKLFGQFIKFGLVGVSNTLISLGIYYLMVWLGCHYLIANIVGFIVSVINSFFWNSKFVFKEKEENSKVKSFVKMTLSYGSTFILSNVLMFLFIDVFGISKYIAPIINLIITIPINFFLNKIWAFKDKTGGKDETETR